MWCANLMSRIMKRDLQPEPVEKVVLLLHQDPLHRPPGSVHCTVDTVYNVLLWVVPGGVEVPGAAGEEVGVAHAEG
jgi:hypothetical protein